MKSSPISWCSVLTFVLCGVASSATFAQDTTPPVVATALSDVTVSVDSAPTVIKLKKTFALQGVTGNLVRFATSEGNIDVELLASVAPASVANFLSYANAGSYNGSFIHRSVPGFVVQGGGYYTSGSNVEAITENAPVVGEHSVSDTRGTLAIALSTGPNSGTNQWFFNLADNSSMLDGTTDGGPFTVFGSVVGTTMSVVDAIAGLQVVDASGGDTSSPFNAVPVLPAYTSGTIPFSDLVYLNSVTNLALIPKQTGDVSALALTVKSSNPGLVTPTIVGQKLTLTYTPGQTGTAVITVTAKDDAKSKAKAKFNVTVQ